MERHETSERLNDWLEDQLHKRRGDEGHGPATQLYAIRGAITVPRDEASCVSLATHELVSEIIAENELSVSEVVSAVFTVTPDLCSAFPATAARDLPGWAHVPLLCAVEIDVLGALPRCIRALVHAYGTRCRAEIRHVYLGGARALRPDLAEPMNAHVATPHGAVTHS